MSPILDAIGKSCRAGGSQAFATSNPGIRSKDAAKIADRRPD